MSWSSSPAPNRDRANREHNNNGTNRDNINGDNNREEEKLIFYCCLKGAHLLHHHHRQQKNDPFIRSVLPAATRPYYSVPRNNIVKVIALIVPARYLPNLHNPSPSLLARGAATPKEWTRTWPRIIMRVLAHTTDALRPSNLAASSDPPPTSERQRETYTGRSLMSKSS